MSRFIKPEIVRLPLSHGDWITVKKYLTAGEQRRAETRLLKAAPAGGLPQVNWELVQLSPVVEYLIDWSFVDDAGHPVPIRDMPADVVIDILNSLDSDSFTEIVDALNAHVKAVAEEKKTRTTASVS